MTRSLRELVLYPTPTAATTVELQLRLDHASRGQDAGAETIAWHLRHHHDTTVSRATINQILARADAVTPDPSKRPKSTSNSDA